MDWDEFRLAQAHLRPGQVIERYAFRGMYRLTGVELLHGLRLTGNATPVHAPSVDIDYCFVDADRLRREVGVEGSGLRLEDLERHLDAREECFGAFVGGVLASYIWFSPGPAHIEGRIFVHFNPSYAFSRWVFTRKDHRGLHLHPLCKRKALEAYTAQGRRGILSVVHAWNISSLNAAAQVGCVRVGWMGMAQGRVWTSARCRHEGIWLGGPPRL
jgi:hypothetical protein